MATAPTNATAGKPATVRLLVMLLTFNTPWNNGHKVTIS